MQCAIYELQEMKKKLLLKKKNLLVLARHQGRIILQWDEASALWTLPGGCPAKLETKEAAVRRIMEEALGDAQFDVELLCGFGVTGEDGKELAGYAYLADVRDWKGEYAARARAFERMPLASQLAEAGLVLGLHKWAGDFFDERLEIERLGDVAKP